MGTILSIEPSTERERREGHSGPGDSVSKATTDKGWVSRTGSSALGFRERVPGGLCMAW